MQAPWPEYNTFSLVGRCERTGMLGIGIATHAYAVGARCVFVQANVGAVATQAITDPRLGRLALGLLDLGYTAQGVAAQIGLSDRHPGYHQIGIVDRDGNAAALTGDANKDWAGHVVGPNFVAMGNYLISPRTVESMAESFEENVALDLDERLLQAIEAGRDAGGQHGGQRSAALLVHDREVFSKVDLRVDAHDEPIGELRHLFERFRGMGDYFTARVRDPKLPKPKDA